MENIENRAQTQEKDIRYYHERFNFIIKNLFLEHDIETLESNKRVVKGLVDNYKNLFENDPQYDRILVGSVETFILNKK